MSVKTASFVRVGAAPNGGPSLPPEPITPGNYGLTYDPIRKAIVFAPATEFHGAGVAFVYDGAEWKPFVEKTMRGGGSITQPWRAVFDAKRGSVVLWSWDFHVGPVGIVLGDGKSPLRRVAKDAERAEDKLVGDAPERDTDATWRDLQGLFAYDRGRDVTVCLAQSGLYELHGSEWRRQKVDLGILPKEVDGSELGLGFVGLYDEKHRRVVFAMCDDDEGDFVLLAWDGSALSRLTVDGLPETQFSSYFGDGGFAVGEDPSAGLVVLMKGELFALVGKDGGFRSSGRPTQGAPPPCKGGQLARDPERDLLVLGPFKAKEPQHRFFVLAKGSWRSLGRVVEKSALKALESDPMIARSGERVIAVGRRGRVMVWEEATSKWRVAIAEDAGEIEAPIQIVHTAWNGVAHAAATDGSVFRLDVERGAFAWTKVVGKTKDFGAPSWPLSAFDEERGLLVVWGERKAKKGRKDDTFVCDGKKWTKAKKGKEKPDGLDEEDSGHFALFFDPIARKVARMSATQIAHFDGAALVPRQARGRKARRRLGPHRLRARRRVPGALRPPLDG